MKHFLLLFALPILSCCTLIKTGEKAIDPREMVNDILVLESDSLEGREPCSAGEQKTVAYLTQRMKELGLKPAFGESYLQSVPLLSIRSLVPDVVNVKTSNGSFSLNVGSDYSAWSPTTLPQVTIENSSMIFVGFGVHSPENEWDDFGEVDLTGKTMIVLVNDPGFYNQDTTLFKGKAMTYYGRWRYKFEEAERRGASACLIVHDEAGAGYPWSVVDRHTNNVEYYIDDPALATNRCMVTGWLTMEAAVRLFQATNHDLPSLMDAAATRNFSPVDLQATLSISINNEFSRCQSANVGGYIRGSKYPDEVIVYSGHWDHLGFGTPIDGDSICHGASDNASAIAWMFGIAKGFTTGTAPERSVLFLSPTAEESGLLGSTFYVQNPAFSMVKTVAVFNTDVFVFLGRYKDITVTGLGHSELDELLELEAGKLGRYMIADPTPENGMFYRSDQLPFLQAGVPALFAKGYTEAVSLGKEKTAEANIDYWKNVYHKPTDRFIPGVHYVEGVYEDAILFYRLGFKLANSRDFPKWKKSSEFYTEK
jgi:Zn-dependent M28 family amino/carboxypeptidase